MSTSCALHAHDSDSVISVSRESIYLATVDGKLNNEPTGYGPSAKVLTSPSLLYCGKCGGPSAHKRRRLYHAEAALAPSRRHQVKQGPRGDQSRRPVSLSSRRHVGGRVGGLQVIIKKGTRGDQSRRPSSELSSPSLRAGV